MWNALPWKCFHKEPSCWGFCTCYSKKTYSMPTIVNNKSWFFKLPSCVVQPVEMSFKVNQFVNVVTKEDIYSLLPVNVCPKSIWKLPWCWTLMSNGSCILRSVLLSWAGSFSVGNTRFTDQEKKLLTQLHAQQDQAPDLPGYVFYAVP